MDNIPKYMKLKHEILSWLQSGKLKENEKIPSENAIANQFNMSRQTVRQTLGVLEQEGWLYRVQGKGTFVAVPNIKNSNEQKTIGIVTTYISDYIFPHIVRGAEATLRDQGYRMLLYSTDNDKHRESEVLQSMINQSLSGLLIEPTKSAETNSNLSYFLSLDFHKIPYIMINEKYPEIDSPCVKMDDELGGFLAAKHLIDLGHKKILGFFKNDDLQGVKRLKGFIRAHKEFNTPLLPEFVIHYSTEEKKEKPFLLAQSMLSRQEERPTAIVCYNDELAILILEAIRQSGLHVPEDISIVGFDNSSLATATEVKLTTLSHPKHDLGSRAATMLLTMLHEQEESHTFDDYIYKPELIIRSSTSKVK